MKFLLTTAALLGLAATPLVAQDAEKKPAKKPDVTVTITGNDVMQFDKKEFEVKSGQVVALTFKHIGKLPVEAMGHNVVILKSGTDVAKFAVAGMANKDNGFLPKDDLKKQILATTKIIGGGKSDTVTFTAPAAGTYDYICTFPGHFGVMRGKMIVK